MCKDHVSVSLTGASWYLDQHLGSCKRGITPGPPSVASTQAACFQIPAGRLPSHLSDLCSTVTSSKEGFCAPLPVSVSTLPPSPPSHFARTFFQKLSIFTYLYFYVLTLTLPQQNVSSLEAHTLSVLFHLFSH